MNIIDGGVGKDYVEKAYIGNWLEIDGSFHNQCKLHLAGEGKFSQNTLQAHEVLVYVNLHDFQCIIEHKN